MPGTDLGVSKQSPFFATKADNRRKCNYFSQSTNLPHRNPKYMFIPSNPEDLDDGVEAIANESTPKITQGEIEYRIGNIHLDSVTSTKGSFTVENMSADSNIEGIWLLICEIKILKTEGPSTNPHAANVSKHHFQLVTQENRRIPVGSSISQ